MKTGSHQINDAYNALAIFSVATWRVPQVGLVDTGHGQRGDVINLVIAVLHCATKLVLIHKQTDHDVMHLDGFRKTDRFAC